MGGAMRDEIWKAATKQKPVHCACQFEWRQFPDFSGAKPLLLDECGYHAFIRTAHDAENKRLRESVEVAKKVTSQLESERDKYRDEADELDRCIGRIVKEGL